LPVQAQIFSSINYKKDVQNLFSLILLRIHAFYLLF
jgi:hypothetical protein